MTGWRKSSYSNPSGNCVEWRKSSHSFIRDCTEVALSDGTVLVRDSKDPAGAVLKFSKAAWQAFTAAVKEVPR